MPPCKKFFKKKTCRQESENQHAKHEKPVTIISKGNPSDKVSCLFFYTFPTCLHDNKRSSITWHDKLYKNIHDQSILNDSQMQKLCRISDTIIRQQGFTCIQFSPIKSYFSTSFFINTSQLLFELKVRCKCAKTNDKSM
jgi:hypothetical protein